MPIYEFRCSQCGQDMELLMKLSDPHPTRCSHCNQEGFLTKRISQTNFVLKGSGWYETDFKTKPTPPVDKKTEAPAGDAAPASAPTGETASTEKVSPSAEAPVSTKQ
jgi:putative FmdB family regulatory protein